MSSGKFPPAEERCVLFVIPYRYHSLTPLKRCHCSEAINVTLLLSQRIWFYCMAVVDFAMVLICFEFLIIALYPLEACF